MYFDSFDSCDRFIRSFVQNMINHKAITGVDFVLNPIPALFSKKGRYESLKQNWRISNELDSAEVVWNDLIRIMSLGLSGKVIHHYKVVCDYGDSQVSYEHNLLNMLDWWVKTHVTVSGRSFLLQREVYNDFAVVKVVQVLGTSRSVFSWISFPTGLDPSRSIVHSIRNKSHKTMDW